MSQQKPKIAIVYTTIPTVAEIDLFAEISGSYDVHLLSSESIGQYVQRNTTFDGLTCVMLPDHDDNASYLPGLEKQLAGYDAVIIKERLGLYAYQAVKAKWQHKFRLLVWIDNHQPFPAEDIDRARTIRGEIHNAADFFIVQTKAARNALLLEGVSATRIKSFSPAVARRFEPDAALKADAKQQLGLGPEHYVISHFGDSEWEYGLIDLIHALKFTIQNHEYTRDILRVVFCGVGTLGETLRSHVVQLGLDDMVLYASPDRHTTETILRATDLCYIAKLPSRDRLSADPYAYLQAMTHSIPILGHRVPVAEELCGKHRIDFCPSSLAGLSQAMMKAYKAPTLTADIAAKNLSRIDDQFSLAKAADKLDTLMTEVLTESTEIAISDIDRLVFDAETKVKNKQYLDAIDIIESTFKQEKIPIHHKANLYRLIGDCFAKLGDTEAAKDSYTKACDLDPFSAKVYVGLGTVGLIKNKYDVAVLHFQKAISLSPSDEMANLGLGLAFKGLEEYLEAGKWVATALRHNPENTAAIFSLVQIAGETGSYSGAIKAIEAYLDRHPNDFNMLYSLGGLWLKAGDAENARKAIDKIIAIDPLDKRALALLKACDEQHGGSADTAVS